MESMIVRDYMTSPVITISVDAPIEEAADRMHTEGISSLLVIDADKKPLGILTKHDFARLAVKLLKKVAAPTLAQMASSGLLTVAEDADCSDAIALLREHDIHRLIVVDSNTGQVSGMITQTDLLHAHTHYVEQQKEVLEKRVAERTQTLEDLNARLEEMAITDPLLGVGNRRAMDEALCQATEVVRRYQRPYSVALVDIDRFKKFNDHFGHQRGDEVLVEVAKLIKSVIRKSDSVYRYGGEEFLVLLPETSLTGAGYAADHIRAALEEAGIPHPHSDYGKLTTSVGVAQESVEHPDMAKTIAHADEALYRAKHEGRNRVEIAELTDDSDQDDLAKAS